MLKELIFNLNKSLKQNTMAKTKITVNNNGSLRIEGDMEVVDKNENGVAYKIEF